MLLLCGLFFLLFLNSDALKILFVQTAFTKSHILFSNSLTEQLAKRGHLVDQIILDFNPSTFDSDNNSRVVYRIAPKTINDFIKTYGSYYVFQHFSGEYSDSDYVEFKCSFCAALLDSKQLIEKLRTEKYDLGVSTLVTACGFGLFHLLEIPAWVSYSPMQNYGGLPYLFGIPQPYVSSPEVFDLSFQTFPTFDHSNILRRTFEFLNRLRIDFVVTPHSWIDEDQLFQQRFENFPSLAELYARSSYVFLGTNPLLDRPRAITSKIKYIGGKHRDGIEPLSEEYTKLLNDKKGGVLFSLGAFSNTSHFPQEIKRSIGRAFARFPDYVFFWKYSDLSDDAEFFSNITNIYRSTWLPQYELLHHSKLHIAITHVGQNSYYEISKAGKPMIAIPLFADQYYNTACGLRNGVAYHVDKTQLSEDTIFKALKEVIENPSYMKRAELIGQAINADPHVGSQEFVLWSEYAAKFPQLSDMQTLETAQMNLFKYLSLDKMKNNAESVSTMAPEVPLLHWRSYRLYLLFILMIVFGVSSCNYMNMGITLTCMVDAQFYEKNNVIAHSEECPNYAENRTELGYKGTLQWTPLQQSQIFAVFFWTNLFTMWCSGALSDRFNAKYLVTAAVSTYAILSLISPLLVSFHYYAFLASRALMGIAESFVFPCMTSIVAHWIPPNERSTAAAIYTSGHQLASLVAVLISSKLCLIDWLNGWPLVFYFFGVCGVFATVLFVTLISNRPEESRLISQKELNYVHEQLLNEGLKKKHEKKMPVPWRSIFTSRAVHAIMASDTSLFVYYLPSFFRDVMFFDVEDNGIYTALPFLVQILAKFAVSITVDKLRNKYGINVSTSCRVLQTASTLGTACIFISMGVFLDCTKVVLAKVLVILFGAFFAGEIAGAFTATLYIAPSFTGTISSITISVGSIAGILCPTIIGFINKHGTREEWSYVFFTGAAVNIIAGIIFFTFGSAKLQPWAVEPESKSKVYQLNGDETKETSAEKL